METEQAAKILEALPPLVWALLAAFVIWLLRRHLADALNRMTSFEAFGIKVAVSGEQAMSAAIELANKHPDWHIVVPAGDRQRALDRAKQERSLLEGAEILWVDDRPSNNRNEARMLRSFGVLITFACTTDEAIRALNSANEQAQPFHVILSDISRDLPIQEKDAGLKMLTRLRAEKFSQPVIYYIGVPFSDKGPPPGSFGLTNRPDQLLHLVLDALARIRSAR